MSRASGHAVSAADYRYQGGRPHKVKRPRLGQILGHRCQSCCVRLRLPRTVLVAISVISPLTASCSTRRA